MKNQCEKDLEILLLGVSIGYGARQIINGKVRHNKSHGFISSIKIGEIPQAGNNFYYTTKIKGKIMALTLTSTQQAEGTLSFVDKKGNPTDVADGAVTVTSSDESIATVTYTDATNTIKVVAAGKTGVAALTVSATARNGSQLPFEDTAIEVVSGDAVGGTISFSTPTEQEEQAEEPTDEPTDEEPTDEDQPEEDREPGSE